MRERVPVTVLTGFLGSGKTTLLNYILTQQHGKRIAVIENEFGEIGIDNELVIQADEEIFEMNNGCICCTVRGDLIRIMGALMKRKDRFDAILIETTGMADPAPVAQTFFVDDELREQLRLDAVITMVDAKHVLLHLDDSSECQEQIAFADVILLNKCDLVTPLELDALEERIRSMNALAKIHRTFNAQIDLDKVLNVGGFDLNRALSVNPAFLEPEYPFEWGGIYELGAGSHELLLQDGPDPEMKALLLPVDGTDARALEVAQEMAARRFSYPAASLHPGQPIPAGEVVVELLLAAAGAKRFPIPIVRPGAYALFTQHGPEEFAAVLHRGGESLQPVIEHTYNPDHEHDEAVSSVGISLAGELDNKRLNGWLSQVLQEQGADIFRMKGILAIKGDERRFVFQGVHMLFDGRPDRPWGAEARVNQLVFIGRNLDRAALTEGLQRCLA